MQLNYGQLVPAFILASCYLILKPGNTELIRSLNPPRWHGTINFLRLKEEEELVKNESAPTGVRHQQVQRAHVRLRKQVAQTHVSSRTVAPGPLLWLQGASQALET